jgi:anti-sigma factor RsiW
VLTMRRQGRIFRRNPKFRSYRQVPEKSKKKHTEPPVWLARTSFVGALLLVAGAVAMAAGVSHRQATHGGARSEAPTVGFF